MTLVNTKPDSTNYLGILADELEALSGRITADKVTEILARSALCIDDLNSFVTPSGAAYSRRSVARTDAFEVLVMSWLPGQNTGAHDHAGSISAFKIPAPLAAIDPREWLEPMLRGGIGLTTRGIAHAIRHARVLWEVTRHRMAPAVAEGVRAATGAGVFRTAAARVLSGHGTLDGVTLSVRRRGESVPEALTFDWIVNCTGPGAGRGVELPPVIAGLINGGHLEEDALGLGVRSTSEGRAFAGDRVIDGLFIVGSLRKADMWESTAVPELRLQAALASELIMQHPSPSAPYVDGRLH
jgi:hypothetical protein